MKICDECEEEIPEKEFQDHKKCTKTLELEYQRKFEETKMEKEKLESELHDKVKRLREIAVKYRDENILFKGRIKTLTEALEKQKSTFLKQNESLKYVDQLILQLMKEHDEETAKEREVAPQIIEQPIIANVVAAPTSSANVTKTEGVEKNLTETEKKNLRSG